MTTIPALLLNRGPDAARSQGLRGRFFLSGSSAIFFERAPEVRHRDDPTGAPVLSADQLRASVLCVEHLARSFEGEGWEVRRYESDTILGFTVTGKCGHDNLDPWDPRVEARQRRLEQQWATWDKNHGVRKPAQDPKRASALTRWRASYETAAERAEREQAEAEASDHG